MMRGDLRIKELMSKGYRPYSDGTLGKADANRLIKKFHSEGASAQKVNLMYSGMSPDYGVRYIVMYKEKK